MPRNRRNPKRAAIRPGSAGASALTTTRSKTIYAADLGRARPLSPANAQRVVRNTRWIAIDSAEQTPHGTLTCQLRNGEVFVRLHKDGIGVGRVLTARLVGEGGGRRVPEAAFSCEIDEFIGTPWHELSYTSVWTVHGLRTRGESELTIET